MATRRRVEWSDEDWTLVIREAHRICERRGDLPLNPAERYGYTQLLKEAQQVLSTSKYRTWPAVLPKERLRLINGVNAHEAAAAARIKRTPASGPSERAYVAGRPASSPAPQPEAAPQEPPKAPPAPEVPKAAPPAFSFESLGRALDGYINGKIIKAVDDVLPAVLRVAIDEAVTAYALDRQASAPPPTPAPKTMREQVDDEQLLGDMVAVLDEVQKLRKLVEPLLALLPTQERQTLHVSKGELSQAQADSIAEDRAIQRQPIEPKADTRPIIIVTGAHPPQAETLRKEYGSKLRLVVYNDVFPSRHDYEHVSVAYVFQKHIQRTQLDKLKGAMSHGSGKVVVVPGGLSAIKRELDKHVREVFSQNAQGLRQLLNQ